MRNFPIDTSRMTMISTGVCAPVNAWVVLADGARRPDPNGRQEVDETSGLPLWRVECILPADADDERDRTGITEIAVAAKDEPDVGAFGDVLTFDGLLMSPGYVKKGTGQLTAPRWTASGIKPRQGAKQHQPQAA